jgi:hypothetical protein
MTLFRRLRGAIGTGLTWALAWAVVGGGLMEGIFDPHGEILDMWPQTLAIPGFFFGLGFSVLLAVAGRRRRFEELSLARFAAWGAGTGAVLGGIALAIGALPGIVPLWLRAAVIVAPVTILSTISSTGSLALARFASRRELIAAPDVEQSLGSPASTARKRIERS